MRTAIHTGTLAAVALAGGCGLGPLRAYRPGSLTDDSIVLNVPLVRQEDRRTCGFAAVTMLSRYYKAPISEEDGELIRIEAESEEGVSGRFLKEVLERNGFRVYVFPGELFDKESARGVAYHLDRGRPLVVMLSPKGSRHHYMVVSGLNASKDFVVCEDPDKGKVICRGRAFRKMWKRSNFFTLLAVPAKMGSGEDGKPGSR